MVMTRLKSKLSFRIVVLGTLAVSVGAATAMFSVVSSFLLSSLPYEHADRLVMLWRTSTEATKKAIDDELPLSPVDFADLGESGRSFARVAARNSPPTSTTSSSS